MTKIFERLCGLFCACFAVFAALLLGNGYAAALLAAIAVWRVLGRGPLPRFTLLLFGGGMALRVAVLLMLHPPVESDFLMMLEAARSLLVGDLSFRGAAYFSLWAYQSVFVAWEAAWLGLWNDPLCLELVNAVLAAGNICLLYRLTRDFASERAARTAVILLTLSPFVLTMHTVLSNQIPSAFFLTLGLWLLVCTDCGCLGFWRFPLAGLALQCGNLLRCEGMIPLVAVLAWGVFEMIRHPGAAKRLLAGLAALLAVYGVAGSVADCAVRESGLNPYGMKNGDPGWKIVTGLNPETSGGYSSEDWNRIFPTLDENYQVTAETETIQHAMIAERLSAGPAALLRHAVKKLRYLWSGDGLHWAMGHLRQGVYLSRLTYSFAREFECGLAYGALCLSAYGLFAGQLRSLRTAAYLPYFVVFAAFCAFLLVEVQPRYVYLPRLFVFASAAFGLDAFGKEKGNA